MSQTPAPRYFHGTTADLAPGDVLRPGADIGVSVHGRSFAVFGTCSDFDPASLAWLDGWDTDANRVATAVGEALEWAADAADVFCDEPQHTHPADPFFHKECVVDGDAPGCLRLYEIEPLGPVEADSSSDAGPSAVMMPSARVVALMPLDQRPVGHF